MKKPSLALAVVLLTGCAIHQRVTYTGLWRWDLALYMSYAEIKVFSSGQPAGEAVCDSTGGGANMSKFIDANTKIKELVEQLFPAKAGA